MSSDMAEMPTKTRSTDGRVPTTTIPRATARLQLHKGFTFEDAAAIVPYLARLGISHVYTSPILTARPGSTHGYDIVDHSKINAEFGGEPAFRAMVRVIREHGMGLVVDIVPNHMGVGGADNAWWLDVLEWGRNSPFAGFFDIDWSPPDQVLTNRIQAPFLGAAYGECLNAGEIRLNFDAATGRLAATYGEHVFPITPFGYQSVFGDLVAHYVPALTPGASRPVSRAAARAMQAHLATLAADPTSAPTLMRNLDRFDPATADGRAHLHRLLSRQHYRLAWWRAAADEINWRRFFDVTSLAGLRAELPAVFDATHALILDLYAQGLIDGVRIDHIDGLADPRAYCRKLRRRMETAGRRRPAAAPKGAPYIVVEKILAAHERLPADWLTNGTTGYDFMDQVAALLHDAAGEKPLSDLWVELTGSHATYEDEERAARRVILRDALASELNATAAALLRVARDDLTTQDYTLTAIRRALVEILVHFPVYRLYAGLAGRPKMDDKVLAWAMSGARRTMRAADHPLLDLINLWLGGESARNLPPGPRRRERLRGIVRFEQLSSPVAAKSVEDTAFYRYGRLLSRNEVGSTPSQFARSPASFHAAARERQQRFPASMLATATHDHKRGADLRVRLAVLSEIPEIWGASLRRWTRLNASLRRELEGGFAPDPATEIMLYQMLVAAWPPGLSSSDAEGVADLAERLSGWQLKALREAKHHTAWVAPDEAYEAACREFIFKILDPTRAARMVDEIADFAKRIGPAGAINGLSQTMLHLTCPGVPDLYQGTERWDFSLVDPDNRRPVDYAVRNADLHTLADCGFSDLLRNWEDGRVKQALIERILAFRQANASLFADGSYLPLKVQGPASNNAIAFARFVKTGDAPRVAIVAATLLPAGLLGEGASSPLVAAASWLGTEMIIPRRWAGQDWTNLLTGAHHAAGSRIHLAKLLGDAPVALLIQRTDAH